MSRGAFACHFGLMTGFGYGKAKGFMLNTDKVNSGVVFGFDYLVDGLSRFLPAGNYYLGIWNNVSGGATLIANTKGTEVTTFGFYQHNGGGPPTFGLTATHIRRGMRTTWRSETTFR